MMFSMFSIYPRLPRAPYNNNNNHHNTMLFDKTKSIIHAVGEVGSRLARRASRRNAAHRQKSNTPETKNIVVIGGSFAGTRLVQLLTKSLPCGYSIVWIEKHSHLNYIFNFPRYSVIKGHEQKAFIPYDAIIENAPADMLTRIQGTVVRVTRSHVLLASGMKIDYEILAIATGAKQSFPAHVLSDQSAWACEELRRTQRAIETSEKIAVVGGGPMGVQLASDIKDFYPDKYVTLIHSHPQLMNHFSPELQDHIREVLFHELQIRILLGERPALPRKGGKFQSLTLTFSRRRRERFDLVIDCTGPKPNSSILKHCFPTAIARHNSRILVRSTLQVFEKTDEDDPEKSLPIFAFGDVANHAGPRMARVGLVQAEVVRANILAMIQSTDEQPVEFKEYRPDFFVEGAINLSLGKKRRVAHTVFNCVEMLEVLIPYNYECLDLRAEAAWREYGANIQDALGDFYERDAETSPG